MQYKLKHPKFHPGRLSFHRMHFLQIVRQIHCIYQRLRLILQIQDSNLQFCIVFHFYRPWVDDCHLYQSTTWREFHFAWLHDRHRLQKWELCEQYLFHLQL